MIDGPQIARTIADFGTTHVIWVPDSTTGPWEEALEACSSFRLLRICREGEAWPLAAGLHLGGQSPLVIMQNTGFFESGDALRNALFDLELPLFSLIGYRSYLIDESPDTAKRFTEPVLDAWGLAYELIHGAGDLPKLTEHHRACQANRRPGVGLIAEGRM